MVPHWLIVLLLFVGGCVASSPASITPPATDALVWSHNISGAENLWRREAEKRFGNPVLLICHGGEANGMWYLFPDPPRPMMPVEAAAWMLSDLYPHRTIVLIVCDEKGFAIHVPRVWSARGNVWTIPDDYFPATRPSGSVGSIEGFVN